ncbi:MAG: VCBS repeat-containing protein [Archangium sp.]|nr:VCBS repeat-containing protein [Archangium sp.]
MRRFAFAAALSLTGCNCMPPPMDDGGVDAGEVEVDAGRPDAGARDAGFDAGVDAGGPEDAGVDAGPGDGGCSYRLDALGGPWTTGRPLALELADLNGDGRPDLIVATTSTLEVRLNDGAGGFPAPSLLGPITPQTLAVSDLDSDGRLDVVAVDVAGRLVVMTGNGDGTLAMPTMLDAGQPFYVPLDTALADVDLDGLLDVVTLDVGSALPDLRVVRGFFDGGAARPATGSHRLVLSDVTADGLVDALVGKSQYGLAVHAGDGDGGFGAEKVFLGSTAVNSFVLRDVTGDGVPDAVCATGYFDGTLTTGGGVAVLAGTGTDAGFLEPQVSPGGRDIIWAIGLADMNRDGVLDAVTTRLAFDGGVEVLAGDDAGTFTSLLRVAGRNGWAIAVSDLNADGWPDVAVGAGAGSNGEVRVLLGSCQ